MKSRNIYGLNAFFLFVTFHNKSTYPRTGIFCSLATLITSWNLSMLSSIEQLIFFLLKVSDTDPNTATSVAPAPTWKKRWIQLNHFHRTESVRGHQTKVEERTDSVVKALNVRCQNRILNMRLFLDSSEDVCMVRHLHKGANHPEYRIFTSHFPAPSFLIEIWSTTYSCKKSICGSDKSSFLWTSADQEKRIIKNSALYHSEQRRLLTCGTHFEETKLVASITGRPVPESMSISWIFTPVGTISWGTMKQKELELALMRGGTQQTLFPPPVTSAISICVHNFCGQGNQWYHRGAAERWWSGDS